MYDWGPPSKNNSECPMVARIPYTDVLSAEYPYMDKCQHESPSNGAVASPAHPAQKLRRYKTTVNIKPLLRGRSHDGASSTSIDLSRSSLEQEPLAISTNLEHDKRYTDNHAYTSDHYRSISAISATSSSTNHPRSQYIHPRRQTPRPFTPPLSHSHDNSLEEDLFVNRGGPLHIVDYTARRELGDKETQSVWEDSELATPGIGEKVVGMTTVPPEHTMRRRETETSVPSVSRLSSNQSTPRTSVDILSHAATVQAARQAFEEKEAAKALKFEMQRIKNESRVRRRNENAKGQTRRFLPIDQSARPVPTGRGNPAILDFSEVHHGRLTNDFPAGNDKKSIPRSRAGIADSCHSTPPGAKRNWMLFLTWLRTRVFKLRRKFCTQKPKCN